MKKIIVLDQDYPSENNLYGDVFVHTRVKEYVKFAEVLIVSFFRDIEDYEYEGITVRHAPVVDDIFNLYHEFLPDIIFIHFYHKQLFSFVSTVKTPVFIWVHGYEALGWYRRLFNYSTYSLVRNIHNIALPNIKQMLGFRKLVKLSNETRRIHFIFVSNWMKRVAQTDSLTSIKNHSIIPNPINTELFKYVQKDKEDRKRILLIRSFNSRKYATDIAIDAILILSKRSFFQELHFGIYGKGKYFKSLTNPLRRFNNIDLFENFIPNNEIPAIHKKFGIFLCPTRQDAQGVSMCEAMSSGLVPISSNNTAIPEFIKHGETGILTDSANEIANAIEALYEDPIRFLTISTYASRFINENCSIADVTAKELRLTNII